MTNLNVQQEKAVTFDGKHLLVLAGAGTGKTRTIIERALYLIRNGIPAHRIMILSFTRKSAREIVERIRSQADRAVAEGLAGQTFHSWCMSIIKNSPDIFKQSGYTVLDEDDRESCFKLLCGKRFKDSDGRTLPAETILSVYSYAMNTQCSLSVAMRKKLSEGLAAQQQTNIDRYIESNKDIYKDIITKYIAYKEERQYMDYDDILNVVSKVMKNNAYVRNYISSRYDHILVDEMQDTNPLQYELLSSFYDNCHLFCVGDDAQSIYGFRGADFQSIHRFTDIVPDAQVCKLTVNYRSTQEILDLSNWLLQQSALCYDKSLQADRGQGIKPDLIHWHDEWEEANDITDKILAAVKDGKNKWADNMVLSRSTFGLKKNEGACIRKNIPYKLYGGTSLMQSAHIRDILSAMRIISNFRDEIAWMRYLQLWKGIGNVTATRILGDIIQAEDLDECLRKLAEKHLQAEITRTLQLIKDLQYNPAKCIDVTVSAMQKRMQEKYHEEWTWRKEDFPVLVEVATATDSIGEFVAEYVLDPKLEESIRKDGDQTDKCILSTIHSAKGLEARNCFVTGVSPNGFPSSRALNNGQEAVEEERRCLYVALTRAKDRLYVYRNISSIHGYERTGSDMSAYFFNGLPVELTESSVIGGNRYFCDERYTGPQLSVENDFLFD